MSAAPRSGAAPAPAALRSLFLSDLHLGAISSRAELALDFLERHRAERYFLVGDILDLWHPLRLHWTPAAQAVIDHIRARHAEGAEVIYVAGNHDPDPDSAPESRRLPVPALRDMVHEMADGRRFLVIHGDALDRRVFRAHAATRLGTALDHALRRVDLWLSRLAWEAPVHQRSLVERLLAAVNACFYPTRAHERRMVGAARARGLDGVICGHFHLAGLHDDHGIVYANCGDWVDNFTALAEDHDGRLTLLGGRRAWVGRPVAVPRPAYATEVWGA